MSDRLQERLAIIEKLKKQKEEIESQLSTILFPEKEVALPPGFSMNTAVLSAVKEAGNVGIAKPNILKALAAEYPNYGINRKKVASALAYLKNKKKQVEIITHGVYRVVESKPVIENVNKPENINQPEGGG